ncbi:hypothetical protein BDN71DRAFT_528871 [Pleurotus eryngii]|uniref:Uncharacterized protein n=1 Tax=Pleurotus eryngii TaxID=5323 RepID=A0A9P6D965_PLEER|nr:hypothetical protein BDN71DRAFT_528871 [Pleurotus eryngii]
MCMEPTEGKLLLDACEKKQTEMMMVHVPSAVPENASDKVVQLQVPVYNKDYMMTQDYCATYDRAPPATGTPIEMRPCGEENQLKSQMFSFNPETKELRPAKFSAGNDAPGITQVGEDEGGLTQRASADSVRMKFVPKNVEISEPSSASAGYTSTITATETFTSTATVTVSATPSTSSSPTTSTSVAPPTSSTMPAALDIRLESPSSSGASSASSTSIEPTETSTSSTTAPTINDSATSTSADAAAVASNIAVGGESVSDSASHSFNGISPYKLVFHQSS